MAHPDFTTGDRLVLPVVAAREREAAMMAAASASRTVAPQRRQLWCYLLDPADIGLQGDKHLVDIPYEPLEPGPVGRLFAVASDVPDAFCRTLGWTPERTRQWREHGPLDLDDARIAASMGLSPSTGEPRFAAQMVYAVCQRIYETFALALGRDPTFGPWAGRAARSGGRTQLLLEPHAFNEDNAYYEPELGALQFGYFRVGPTNATLLTPGSLQQYALSHDIVAHELTHALLDGLRANFIRDTNPDVAAFHEGFADLIALFHHFTCEPLVRQSIEETGGLHVKALLGLGRLLGESDSKVGGSAMRHAVDALTAEMDDADLLSDAWRGPTSMADTIALSYQTAMECHERGGVLVAAVFEAFLITFERRARPYRRLAHLYRPSTTQGLPAELVDLLTAEVSKLADHFLHVLIRAIDYCPAVDIRFGDYLRAVLTADRDLMPADEYDYRGALIRAFRRRGIPVEHVLDLSEESLCWGVPETHLPPVPELGFSHLRLTDDGTSACSEDEIHAWAERLMRYVFANDTHARAFGLRRPSLRYQPPVVESIAIFRRRDEQRRIQRGLIAEISQQRDGSTGRFLGGVTVVLDDFGGVRYLVRKRVDNPRRGQRAEIGPSARDGQSTSIEFQALHRGR